MKQYIDSQIRINSTIPKIMAALTEIPLLEEWWGISSGYIEKKDNGLYTLTWHATEEGIKYITTGRIYLYNKRSHLYLHDLLYLNNNKPILGPFKIEYDLSKEPGNIILLRVKQTGFKKDNPEQERYYESVKSGWPQALIMLKEFLES